MRFPTSPKILFLLLILLVGSSSDLFGQRRGVRPPPRAPRSALVPIDTDKLNPDQKRRVESFEKVWRTIYFYYFDGNFNNVNWESLKFEFEPKVLSARSDAALHDLLDEMIGRLRVSHLAIIRPAVYEAISAAKEAASRRAAEREKSLSSEIQEADNVVEDEDWLKDALSEFGPGIDLRLIGDQFVIFRVGANSPAERAGVKTGYIVDTIDDVSMPALFKRISQLEKGGSRTLRFLPIEIVQELLNGERETTVKIGLLDENNKPREVLLDRERIRSTIVSLGDNVPERPLTFESRTLDESTAYVFFDNFSLPVIEKFCAALDDFKDKKALIIDLRGNLGGTLGVLIGLSGMLSGDMIEIGTSIFRFGPENMASQPKAKRFNGKVVVLVDELSVSAAEMFAAAMQSSGRAMIVGARSAGETLPAVAVELPTGARLYYPIANFRTSGGIFLEGKGVEPNKFVTLDRNALLIGKDNQLAAALELVNAPVVSPGSATLKGFGQGFSAPMTGESDGPVPPPPPAPKKLRNLGTVTIKAPPAPAEPPDKIEPTAANFLTGFEKLVGGYPAYESIASYKLSGYVKTVSLGASEIQEYIAYREGDSRHLVILRSGSTGETRNLRDGRTIKVKTDYGIDIERPYAMSIAESDFLFSIMRSMKVENYSKLLYLGEFQRGERKVHLIDGKTNDGATVAIYFDTETKLLAGFETSYGGLSFSDYRQVGDLKFPFNISSGEVLDIQLDEVILNSKIDPAVFERKVNCFDIP
ncbi:hypothetical protein BH24ACI3_BH24ACI3_10800 [soil metagenome]